MSTSISSKVQAFPKVHTQNMYPIFFKIKLLLVFHETLYYLPDSLNLILYFQSQTIYLHISQYTNITITASAARFLSLGTDK
jgi:hypothetical protein